jgi:hypothetical protein
VNYSEYQEKTTSKTTSKTTLNRQAGDKQATASKECIKNEKNEENENFLKSEEGRKAFRDMKEKIVREKALC